MPGKMKRFAFDPNFGRGPVKYRVQTDRGAGLYYHRGNDHWTKVREGSYAFCNKKTRRR